MVSVHATAIRSTKEAFISRIYFIVLWFKRGNGYSPPPPLYERNVLWKCTVFNELFVVNRELLR